ncbi:hypothetical protein BH10PSE7_BH10PSE7_36080 [soil metagenome]
MLKSKRVLANAKARVKKTVSGKTKTITIAAAPDTKAGSILALLSRKEGASLNEMAKIACWQPHSVRGFLAGHVRKKLGLALSSEKLDGVRRYRVGT